MKYFYKKAFKIIVLLVAFFSPMVMYAALGGIVPCSEPDFPGSTGENVCNWNALVLLARRFLNYLIILSIPLATILFAWAGGMLVSAGPDEGKREKAKDIFTNVLIGFLVICSAWLIIYLLTTALLKNGYSFLTNIK